MDYVIAVDMGGTNTVLAIVDRNGVIVGRRSIPTVGDSDFMSYALRVKSQVDSLIALLPDDSYIIGMGAGVPCANSRSGMIEAATNLPWPSPIPVAEVFSSLFKVPAFITNDANAAAAGEMLFGSMKDCDNFILLTLGTGVGAGVVCDGHLLSGSHGFAGELGHVIVQPTSKRICECGRPGCLQSFCSASGIVRSAIDFLGFTDSPSILRDIPADDLTSEFICNAARQGDMIAKNVFDFTGGMLGMACANFAAILDPDAIVLAGGVAHAGELLTKPAEVAFRNASLSLYHDVKFLTTSLNDTDCALLGAAALALNID
ncbi:MAG: ROK family protein [Clostridium sp.]|nr:ROK family protein [Prevotella sp.]MCM1428809.1 ROK family protein [Clostridium sp.]MCM1475184.1 ROK family protein [Muribaculaceae bacterium]